MEPLRTIDPPSFSSGSAFCTVKSVPFTLVSKVAGEVLLGDGAEREQVAAAGIGEEDVDLRVLLPDGVVEPVDVGEVRMSPRSP